MIEIKKPGSALLLNKTTVIIDDVQLNGGSTSTGINFIGTPILFITIENNTSVNFTEMHLIDGDDAVITHNAPLNPGAYSIAFSGKNSGQPLTSSDLGYLNNVRVEWLFPPGLAVGTLTINIYTFAI
jgi:hypothetical protein